MENQTLEGFDWGEADLTDAIFNNCLIRRPVWRGDARGGGVQSLPHPARADLRDTLFEDCNFADPEAHAGLSPTYSRLDQAAERPAPEATQYL